MFIQREKELFQLNNSFNEPNSTINFIFGSNDIGKTALIREFSKDKDTLYISNHEMIATQFFTKLTNIINNYFHYDDVDFKCNNFLDVLDFLYKQNIKSKLVIIFDDFQNIQSVDKNALSDLVTFWKKSLKNKNIQVIISSSTLFSDSNNKNIEKISSNVIRLKSHDFSVINKVFPSMKKLDQLYVYSILGTNINNLKYYNEHVTFTENIHNLFLSPDSNFFNYGINVLKKNISDISTYSSILYAISQGNTKIGDIAKSLDVKSTYLTRYIQKLIDIMIIKKIVPLGEDINKSKFGRYEIHDNILHFWFSYVYPNLSKLQSENTKDIENIVSDEFISRTVFKSYKNCVEEYIVNNQKDIFSYETSFIGSWWNNNKDNIDLIAYNNKFITFVKILWEDKDSEDSSYNKLEMNAKKFETTLERKYILITKDNFLNN